MIEEIIKPETELEKKIIADPEFIEGALWGKPRNGHSEGQVIYHISDVLNNIDKLPEEYPSIREKLRLIAIIHDSFKYKVDRTQPKIGENHHAMIARRFAEKYIIDNEILDLIELHDEAYNAWCKGDKNNNWQLAKSRARQLIMWLGKSLHLYHTFYQCDNATGDKLSDDFKWFTDFHNELQLSKYKE